MLQFVETDKAKELLDGYYQVLNVTGYVKHTTVEKFLIWLFSVVFVERVYTLLTNEDYDLINSLLFCLFNSNDCLLPYEPQGDNVVIGEALYMGSFDLRATEDKMLRQAESTLRQLE